MKMKEDFKKNFILNKNQVQKDDTTYSYYSNVLKKVFSNVEDLKKAEKEYEDAHKVEIEKANVKKERAKEIEQAYKLYVETTKKANKEVEKARQDYLNLKNKFINDYGYFHMTYNDTNDSQDVSVSDTINDIFDFFKWFPFIK